MAGTPMPYVLQQWFTNAGAVASGYQMFVYEAGTSTKTTTYSDAGLTTPNTNPVVLNSAGRPSSGGIFLGPGTSYKFVLAPSGDTDPPTSPIWTIDNVPPVPESSSDVDVTATLGQTVTANQWVYISDGTDGNTAGRWYLTDADLTAAFNAVWVGPALAGGDAGDQVTVRLEGRMTGLSGLVGGTVYYLSATAGAITSTAPAYRRRVLIADGTTSGILLPQEWAVNVQTFAGSGTYTKPPGTAWVHVIAYGAGGGGGGGVGGEAGGAVSQSGSGGGGGARVERSFWGTNVPTTVTVTIGGGGAGGAGGAGGSPTSGSDGTAGGNTTFGTLLTAYGGGGGAGGNSTPADHSGGGGGGSGGVGDTGSTGGASGGGPGGTSGVTANADVGGGSPLASQGRPGINGGGGGGGSQAAPSTQQDGGQSMYAGGGGGSGGGVSAANTAYDGGEGGDTGADVDITTTPYGDGGAGGIAGAAFTTAQNGAAGDSTRGGQGGGGGGARRDGTAAAAGGGGGFPAGGGGGGGAGQSTATPGGAGGAGSPGAMYVFSHR